MRSRATKLSKYQEDYAVGDPRAVDFLKFIRQPEFDAWFVAGGNSPAVIECVNSGYLHFLDTGKLDFGVILRAYEMFGK